MLINTIFGWSDIGPIGVFLFLKLAFTVYQKREILRWKKRIFTKRMNFVTLFLDKSTKLSQRIVKAFVWFISLILIGCLCIGIYVLFNIEKEYDKREKTYKTVDELFERLHDKSTLTASDRLFISKQRTAYLRDNFFLGSAKSFFGSVNFRGWQSEKRYFDYALYQYRLGRPEDFLTGIHESVKSNSLKHHPQATIKAAFELGLIDECRKLIEIYLKRLETGNDHSINESDSEIIRIALKVGLFDRVKEIFDFSNEGVLGVCKAHALLMTGEREKALTLYRQQINNTSLDRKAAIKKDFAAFRRLHFPDTDIFMIERELHLDKINVCTLPDDDTNTALAQPFTGNWQFEENDRRIRWEITANNHNLCRYLFQTKADGTNQWIDDDIAVTRYRFKQSGSQTLIEEYNVRTNTLSVNELTLLDNNELQTKAINNGSADFADKIRIFRRVK
jgi:hypothetical protein